MGSTTCSMPVILVVDDDEIIRELLLHELSQDGYEVTAVGNGADALECLASRQVDLVLLDIMLPGMDGVETLRRIREDNAVPVILLTAKSDELDKIVGFEIGADDYVTKDLLSVRELRGRVRALLRRTTRHLVDEERSDCRRVGLVEVEIRRRRVSVGGNPVNLTFAEFEILKMLILHPGVAVSRAELLASVWGSSDFRDERVVDTHVRHIRQQIEPAPSNPEYILTVRNVGYMFRDV